VARSAGVVCYPASIFDVDILGAMLTLKDVKKG
jgi:hypothetical protein